MQIGWVRSDFFHTIFLEEDLIKFLELIFLYHVKKVIVTDHGTNFDQKSQDSFIIVFCSVLTILVRQCILVQVQK